MGLNPSQGKKTQFLSCGLPLISLIAYSAKANDEMLTEAYFYIFPLFIKVEDFVVYFPATNCNLLYVFLRLVCTQAMVEISDTITAMKKKGHCW